MHPLEEQLVLAIAEPSLQSQFCFVFIFLLVLCMCVTVWVILLTCVCRYACLYTFGG